MSHGAVVAREYGLPAVVGVVGATDFFQSGETIVLDGSKGLVAKHRVRPDSLPLDLDKKMEAKVSLELKRQSTGFSANDATAGKT